MGTVYVHPPSYSDEDGARAARVFRNAMINRIGDSPQPLYSIQSNLSVSLKSLGITQENLATRYQAFASLSYVLFRLDQTGKAMPKKLTNNSITSWAGYDVVNSPISDVIAERDAIDRVSKELAELLYLRIASYFAQKPQRQNGAIRPLSAF
ncbi:LPS assembly lipoprotein LptE [Rhodospirillum sp. A1_3_36]|uniref:LPS assembly lipoprotein LptE n=1 Tax=Rhodospirillum sp. A1_3_36 TaxID=3391666 RepID=UPI0039A5BC7F